MNLNELKNDISNQYDRMLICKYDEQSTLNDRYAEKLMAILEKQNQFFVDFFKSKGWNSDVIEVNTHNFHDHKVFYVYDSDGFGFAFYNNGYNDEPSTNGNYMMYFFVKLSKKYLSIGEVNQILTGKYETPGISVIEPPIKEKDTHQYILFRSDKETLDDVFARFNKKFNKKEKDRILSRLQKVYPIEFRKRKLDKLKEI